MPCPSLGTESEVSPSPSSSSESPRLVRPPSTLTPPKVTRIPPSLPPYPTLFAPVVFVSISDSLLHNNPITTLTKDTIMELYHSTKSGIEKNCLTANFHFQHVSGKLRVTD
ncbi:hypothetical protein QR680_011425 [Steinernema hermaphroditum]|uniref:Uncharacterized protein n=1 Tax=Steinernema hermaphroditum TaxID=289476 RepID=A0AA39I020_9BILA|nr:hypothetical protein QR680_011425 [Steinernema hermaphroditum]